MRALKIALSVTTVLGIATLLGMPWVLRLKPEADASKEVRMSFLLAITSYTAFLFLLLALCIILAWRLVRKQQEYYLEVSRKNLESLIEGTLADHERKKSF